MAEQLTQEEAQAKFKAWLAEQVKLGGCPSCGHMSGALFDKVRQCSGCGARYEVKPQQQENTDGSQV